MNTFNNVSLILLRQKSKLRLSLPTDLENLILSNELTKFIWAVVNSAFGESLSKVGQCYGNLIFCSLGISLF